MGHSGQKEVQCIGHCIVGVREVHYTRLGLMLCWTSYSSARETRLWLIACVPISTAIIHPGGKSWETDKDNLTREGLVVRISAWEQVFCSTIDDGAKAICLFVCGALSPQARCPNGQFQMNTYGPGKSSSPCHFEIAALCSLQCREY